MDRAVSVAQVLTKVNQMLVLLNQIVLDSQSFRSRKAGSNIGCVANTDLHRATHDVNKRLRLLMLNVELAFLNKY